MCPIKPAKAVTVPIVTIVVAMIVMIVSFVVVCYAPIIHRASTLVKGDL